MSAKQTTIKQLYLEGKSITDIATITGVTRQTIYAQKKRDLKEGIDWDELQLARAQDVSGTKMSEKAFLSSLIKSYEEALEGLNALSPKERLMLTTQYAQSYYRLKAPFKTDCKAQVMDAITKSIYKISEIAIEEDNKAVIEFLSKHSEKIVQRCINKKGNS